MSDDSPAPLDVDAARRIDDICNRFEGAWKSTSGSTTRPRLEDYLTAVPDAERFALLQELIPIETFHRRRLGDSSRADDYLGRFPSLDGAWLRQVIAEAGPPPDEDALSTTDLIVVLRRHQILSAVQLDELPWLQSQFREANTLTSELVRRGWLTPFQAELLLQGKGDELQVGKYIVQERLGEGGMGTVYRARNARLDKAVALKIIRRDFVANEDAVRRFHREIRAASKLSHPNIVHAFDADTSGETHFFVMELVEGTDLRRLLKERGPLPVAEACEYVRQTALGLQHAFEQGLVHRDIKPSNLLLTRREKRGSSVDATEVGGSASDRSSTIKLLDMGLARLAGVGDGDSTSKLTATGALLGTADYIAPEQAHEAHEVDIRADLYSLGCTLYHLLAGRVPFPGGSFIQKALHHKLDEPERVEQLRSEVPPAVAAIVRKLMSKRPEDRYQTPAELADALAQFLNPPAPKASVAQRPVDPFGDFGDGREKGKEPTRSMKRILAAVGFGVCVVTLAVLLILKPWQNTTPIDPEPEPQTPPVTPPVFTFTIPAPKEALAALIKRGAIVHRAGGQPDGVVFAVDLTGQKQLADEDLINLSAFPKLYTMHLTKTDITGQGLRYLKPLTELADLRMTDCVNVGDAGLTSLAHFKNLQILFLDGTKVTNDGMKQVQQLPRLTRLILAGTKVGDEGVKHLQSLANLESLTLSTQITDAAFAHLEHHVKLRQLYAGSKGINDPGVARLSRLANMEWLALDGSRVTDDGLKVLTNMPRLVYLNLRGTQLNGSFLKHLRCQSTLEQVHLHQAPIEDAHLKHLAGLKKLSALDLSMSKVTDAGLEALRELPQLRMLALDGTQVTGSFLKHLRCQLSLQFLHLANTSLSDEALRELAGMKKLSNLYLESAKVTHSGMQHLRTLPALAHLQLTFTTIGDPGLKHLEGMKSLRVLELRGTGVTDDGMKSVATIEGLEQVNLGSTTVSDVGFEKLQTLKHLTEVNINNTHVGVEAVRRFSAARPGVKIVR